MKNVLQLFLIIFTFYIFPFNGFSQIIWNGSVSTDWGDPLNWTPNQIPTLIDNVNINTALLPNYPVINSGTYRCRTLSMTNAVMFTMNGGTLEVYGNWSKANASVFTANGGTVEFKSTNSKQIIAGRNTFQNITINNTALSPADSVYIQAVTVVTGNVTLVSGLFCLGSGTGSNPLEVDGNWVSNGGKFQPNFGAVTFDGGIDKTIGGSSSLGLTFYDVNISKSSGAQAITITDPVTINNSLEIQKGELVINPSVGIDLIVKVDLRIVGDAALFLNNTAGVRNVEIQIGRNLIDFNTLPPSRNVSANTANGINYTDRKALFTFNGSDPAVNQVIRGYSPVTAYNAGNSLLRGCVLPSVIVNTASVLYLENDGCRILDSCVVSSGTFRLNGRTLIFGNALASPNAGTFNVHAAGVLDCDGGSSLLFSSVDVPGPILQTTGNGGRINFVGTSNQALVRIQRDALSGNYFRVEINDGGFLSARYYVINLIHQSGLIMKSGSTLDNAPNNLSDGTFNETNAGASITYLTLNNDIPGGTTIENVNFNYSAIVKNCSRPAAAVGVVTFRNCYGVRSGPGYETDPADPTPGGGLPDTDGKIQWNNTGATQTWTGAVSTNWYVAGNWLSGIVPVAGDNIVIPTAASTRYPVLEADVTVFNLSITANVAAKTIFDVNAKVLTVTGSINKSTASGTFSLPANSRLRVKYGFTFTTAANFSAASNSTTEFFGVTAWDNAYTFGNVEMAGNIFISNAGDNCNVVDFTLTNGNIVFVNQQRNLNVRGNWTNNGGYFTPVGSRITFASNTTSTKTILSRGQVFSTISFDPVASGSCVYQLSDDMYATSPGTGTGALGTSILLTGASGQTVTLELNQYTLYVNNLNISSGVAGSATLTLNQGSILSINSGFTIRTTGTGAAVIFDGLPDKRCLVTRQGNGTYTFDLSAGAPTVSAIYTDFEYMNGSGINVSGASAIDATKNFSYCSFSNFTQTSGQLLNLPNLTVGPIQEVLFYYSGNPSVGTHFNVYRASGALISTFNNAKGNLSGPKYEKDPVGTTTPGVISWSDNYIYWGNFTTGNWNDAPSKWRNLGGSVVPIPTNIDNVLLDHTHCAGTYTITVDAASNCNNLTMRSGATNAIQLNTTNQQLTIKGNFEMESSLDTLISNGIIDIWGNWLMNKGIFLPQTGSNVRFVGNSNSIASGATNAFYNITINNGSNTTRLLDDIRIDKDISLTSGNFDVGTGNYGVYMRGGHWVGTNGLFTPRNGTVYFTGIVGQNINNANAQKFNNLEMNKGAGNINLFHDIYINSTLNFTTNNRARINCSGKRVRMMAAASAVGVNKKGTNGYVNGQMSFIFNSSAAIITKFYTIGKDGVYLPFELSMRLGDDINTEIVGEQFNAAPPSRTTPTLPEEVPFISNAHYFTISKIQPTTISYAKVIIQYNEDDATSLSLLSETTLRLLKESADGLNWDNLTPAGPGGYGNTSTGFLISTVNWTTFSDFVVGSTGDPLPVQYLKFNANYNPKEKQADLDWITAHEVNNAGFSIQRSDNDMLNFHTIATFENYPELVGKGSSLENNYEFIDKSTLTPGKTYYYRLTQHDFNGATKESEVKSIVVPIDDKLFARVYPNPFNECFYTEFQLTEAADIQFEIFDYTGKITENLINKSLPSGYYNIQHSVTHLSNGIYFYKLAINGKVYSGKIIKN
ncbi:MAG: T9SS type A sorting domain-containing protein [Bacteroidia bacterium]|nr:T9SS type A sorting domain-containing protein [Bacteroidia bacterium]